MQYPAPTENLIAKLRDAASDAVNTHPAHAMLMRAAANRLVEYYAAAEDGDESLRRVHP